MTLTPQQMAFYEQLRLKLQQTTSFPSIYLFKFILANDIAKKEQLLAIIRREENKDRHLQGFRPARVNTQYSSSGKYESFSVEMWVETPDRVIEIYQSVAVVEGITSL